MSRSRLQARSEARTTCATSRRSDRARTDARHHARSKASGLRRATSRSALARRLLVSRSPVVGALIIMNTNTANEVGPWLVVMHAEDGAHVHIHKRWATIGPWMRGAGFKPETIERVRTMDASGSSAHLIDEWGRKIDVSVTQQSMTVRRFRSLMFAYTARECDTMTSRQSALLAKWGW